MEMHIHKCVYKRGRMQRNSKKSVEEVNRKSGKETHHRDANVLVCQHFMAHNTRAIPISILYIIYNMHDWRRFNKVWCDAMLELPQSQSSTNIGNIRFVSVFLRFVAIFVSSVFYYCIIHTLQVYSLLCLLNAECSTKHSSLHSTSA